jgi:hypothetical protein
MEELVEDILDAQKEDLRSFAELWCRLKVDMDAKILFQSPMSCLAGFECESRNRDSFRIDGLA